MTRDEYLSLGRGDVILFGRRGRPRLVIKGPRDHKVPRINHRGVTPLVLLAKMIPSRYGSHLTCYDLGGLRTHHAVRVGPVSPTFRKAAAAFEKGRAVRDLGIDVRRIERDIVREYKRLPHLLDRLKCGALPKSTWDFSRRKAAT